MEEEPSAARTNRTLSRHDAKGRRWRESFTTCLSNALRSTRYLSGRIVTNAGSSNVIDVFTAQQPHLQVSGPYGPSRTPRIPSIAQAKKDCIAPLQARPQYSTTNEDEPTRADLSLRTIKKGRAGPIFSHRDQGITGLRAVQDAIG